MGKIVAGLVGVLVLVAIGLTLTSTSPWHELSIVDRDLQITEVNGEPPPDGHVATLLLHRGGRAILRTSCGETDGRWGGDTDTDWLTIGMPTADLVDCATEGAAFDRSLRHALAAVGRWRIVSADEIVLEGEVPVRLVLSSPAS